MFKLRSLKPAMAATACAGVLVLGGTGIAAAAGPGGQGSSGDSGQHAAVAATCTHLWAVVNAAGKLQRAGCKGITSKILGSPPIPGHYQVIFPRNVRNCAYVATIGNAGSASTVNHPGFAGVVGRTGNVRGVFVQTFLPNGTTSSAGFHLIVECK
ncbi:MAG TPA: hypothetical protein VGF32_31915 [Streptosporangiaceae bacterium]|jgi:hypothetical protein